MFVGISVSATVIAHQAEQRSRARFKAQRMVHGTKARIEGILSTLMPPLVVQELRKRSPHDLPPTHQYNYATIAQSDLCGFTALASTRTPCEVVEFMGELFGSFDKLTDKFGIYKVE